jgi:hypothetical protein
MEEEELGWKEEMDSNVDCEEENDNPLDESSMDVDEDVDESVEYNDYSYDDDSIFEEQVSRPAKTSSLLKSSFGHTTPIKRSPFFYEQLVIFQCEHMSYSKAQIPNSTLVTGITTHLLFDLILKPFFTHQEYTKMCLNLRTTCRYFFVTVNKHAAILAWSAAHNVYDLREITDVADPHVQTCVSRVDPNKLKRLILNKQPNISASKLENQILPHKAIIFDYVVSQFAQLTVFKANNLNYRLSLAALFDQHASTLRVLHLGYSKKNYDYDAKYIDPNRPSFWLAARLNWRNTQQFIGYDSPSFLALEEFNLLARFEYLTVELVQNLLIIINPQVFHTLVVLPHFNGSTWRNELVHKSTWREGAKFLFMNNVNAPFGYLTQLNMPHLQVTDLIAESLPVNLISLFAYTLAYDYHPTLQRPWKWPITLHTLKLVCMPKIHSKQQLRYMLPYCLVNLFIKEQLSIINEINWVEDYADITTSIWPVTLKRLKWHVHPNLLITLHPNTRSAYLALPMDKKLQYIEHFVQVFRALHLVDIRDATFIASSWKQVDVTLNQNPNLQAVGFNLTNSLFITSTTTPCFSQSTQIHTLAMQDKTIDITSETRRVDFVSKQVLSHSAFQYLVKLEWRIESFIFDNRGITIEYVLPRMIPTLQKLVYTIHDFVIPTSVTKDKDNFDFDLIVKYDDLLLHHPSLQQVKIKGLPIRVTSHSSNMYEHALPSHYATPDIIWLQGFAFSCTYLIISKLYDNMGCDTLCLRAQHNLTTCQKEFVASSQFKPNYTPRYN